MSFLFGCSSYRFIQLIECKFEGGDDDVHLRAGGGGGAEAIHQVDLGGEQALGELGLSFDTLESYHVARHRASSRWLFVHRQN